VLACLYDVHGNLPALEAVLADASELGGEWPQHIARRIERAAAAE
jgi:hypothetical protein